MLRNNPKVMLDGSVNDRHEIRREASEQPRTAVSWLTRIAWLPVPVAFAVVVALWALHPPFARDSASLVIVSSFFHVLAALITVWVIARSFLAQRYAGLLLVCCGVVLWGVSSEVATAMGHDDPNISVTIHNSLAWLSALCQLWGVILLLRTRRTLRLTGLWLVTGFVVIGSLVAVLVLAALAGSLPPFFIQNQGGTGVRYFVLGSAIGMLMLSAALLRLSDRLHASSFARWYSMSLALIAVGLFGVMMYSSRGSLLNWTGRATQLLGSAYMLVAALAFRRESGEKETMFGQALEESRYRFGVASVVVITAVAIRLAFLQPLGSNSPFVTFYPAVVFAVLYGGRWAGILASLLSAFAAILIWMEPAWHLSMRKPSDWLGMAIFIAGCMIIVWATETARRSRARAHEAEAQLELSAERERATETLRQAHAQLARHVEQLGETNKELESFAYTISHDLRSPLRAINVFAHTLADREASSLSDDGRRRLRVIETNAVKMGQLIDDLLAFSRAGRADITLSRIDMNRLTAEVLESLNVGDPGQRLGVEVKELPDAQGDPAFVRQVLINLLANAVKFSGKRADRRIEVGGSSENGEQIYYVKDNGIGFDMKYYGDLFRVFHRLVTEKEFEGTGVGLAIVHRLVARHGGRAWAEGTPGEGATFYFSLPQKG